MILEIVDFVKNQALRLTDRMVIADPPICSPMFQLNVFHVVGNPIVLGDDGPGGCETDIDCGNQACREPGGALFSNLETAFDSRTSVSPPPGACRGIERNDFTEIAQHLRFAEHDSSTSGSVRLYFPSSRLSSEPLYDHIDADHSTDHARSEVVISHSAHPRNPPRSSRLSSLNQLSQEDRSSSDRSKPNRLT